MAAFKAMEPVLEAAPGRQVSLTDPDARSMATSGRGSGIVGYNVQAAVDAKHHLIVAHEVTNVGNDRDQLATMAGEAKAAMGSEQLEALADRGYFDGEQILACQALGVTPYVPKPLTSGAKADGRFGKQDFVYLADEDAYRCPAGQKLPYHMTTVERGLTLRRYWDRASCQACALKSRPASPERPDHRAGSMRRSLRPCRNASTASPPPCASEEPPSSTPSAHSRPGWAPLTSRPRPSKMSEPR